MFFKKKRAWFWNVIFMLVVIRIVYGFARFFLKVIERQAGWKVSFPEDHYSEKKSWFSKKK